MVLAKLGKVIFRRIRGRLIPIRVKVKENNFTTFGEKIKELSFTATRGKEKLASASGIFVNKKHFELSFVQAKKVGQGHGSDMFRGIVKELNKRKVNKLTGLVKPVSQIKIRSKFQPTKFKSMLGEVTRSVDKASLFVKSGGAVFATTNLKAFRRRRNVKRVGLALGGIGSFELARRVQ